VGEERHLTVPFFAFARFCPRRLTVWECLTQGDESQLVKIESEFANIERELAEVD
jgi:hypothetical protein